MYIHPRAQHPQKSTKIVTEYELAAIYYVDRSAMYNAYSQKKSSAVSGS